MLEGLEDDNSEVFKGGTLEITQETYKLSKENTTTETKETSSSPKTKIWDGISPIMTLPKKISGTLFTNKDQETPINSDTKTQIIPVLKTESPSDYFTFRDGVIERAVKECIEMLIVPEIDGPVIGSFLLTEISLWDMEKERLVILTSNFIFSIKYDFIGLHQIEFRKISLDKIDAVICGELIYPQHSLVPRLNGLANGLTDTLRLKFLQKRTIDDMFQPSNRNSRGIRLMWNKGEPVSFSKRWNPFTNDTPFLTFTSHPLYMLQDSFDEKRKNLYSLDVFIQNLIDTVENALITKGKSPCLVQHKEILLDTYVGLGSIIHNKNSLGFFKVRGKFSF